MQKQEEFEMKKCVPLLLEKYKKSNKRKKFACHDRMSIDLIKFAQIILIFCKRKNLKFCQVFSFFV